MSEDLIYYKKYDEPIVYFDKITNKEHYITGEWICKSDKVKRVWFLGCSSAFLPSPMWVKCMVQFNDESIYETKKYEEWGDAIKDAEQYILNNDTGTRKHEPSITDPINIQTQQT